MDGTSATSGGGAGEIMLFGVRVIVDSMRKSVSLNNLSQYEQPQELLEKNLNLNIKESSRGNNNNKEDVAVAAGYASADEAVPHSSAGRAERKRGVPWTEEEHKLFLLGLQKVGKGDWRGISRNFVKTRTPTQVASHAQKYFLRRTNINRRRRRSSLFDITTDTVTAIPMEEEQAHHQENRNNKNTSQSHSLPPPPPETSTISNFPLMRAVPVTANPIALPTPIENPIENLSLGHHSQAINSSGTSTSLIRLVPIFSTPQASTISDLNLNLNSDLNLNLKSTIDPSPLSLKLSLPSDPMESSSSSRHSAFQSMSSFSDGDSIISVA